MTRVPLRVLLSGGLALTGVGLLVMSGRGVGDEWTALLPGFVITGFGVGLINPVVANLALSTVPNEQSGVASGSTTPSARSAWQPGSPLWAPCFWRARQITSRAL